MSCGFRTLFMAAIFGYGQRCEQSCPHFVIRNKPVIRAIVVMKTDQRAELSLLTGVLEMSAR